MAAAARIGELQKAMEAEVSEIRKIENGKLLLVLIILCTYRIQ